MYNKHIRCIKRILYSSMIGSVVFLGLVLVLLPPIYFGNYLQSYGYSIWVFGLFAIPYVAILIATVGTILDGDCN